MSNFTPQPDIFHPTLTLSEEGMTEEFWYYVDRILETCSSDIQFAAKAKESIRYILSHTVQPV